MRPGRSWPSYEEVRRYGRRPDLRAKTAQVQSRDKTLREETMTNDSNRDKPKPMTSQEYTELRKKLGKRRTPD